MSEAINEAIRRAGSQGKLAKRVGVSQQAVNVWVKNGFMPPERASQVESQFGIPAVSLIDPQLANIIGRCPNCDE